VIIAVAVVLGIFSGFLIYMESALLFTSTGEGPSTLFVWVTFLIGWGGATYFMVRGTKSISKVFSRGFLIGAAEWFALIPVGFLFSGKMVGEVAAQTESGAAIVGATMGGGIISFFTGGVALFMSVVCLVGFAISYSLGREMKPEASVSTKKCPDCAEMIQADARKCRFCGCELPEVPSAPKSSTRMKGQMLPGMKKCPKCSANIMRTAIRCLTCGTKF